MNAAELELAQKRVRQLYAPDLARALLLQLSELLPTHLKRAGQGIGPVVAWRSPEENIKAAHVCLEGGAPQSSPSGIVARFSHLIEVALSRGHSLHHPGYIGHQVPASVPMAGLFDSVNAFCNQVMAIYEMGPWVSAVEQAVVEQVGAQLGFRAGEFSGFATHGGSLANVTALLTARNVALPGVWAKGLPQCDAQPVIVSHAEAHYCIARSAGILGMGADQVVKAPLDRLHRMDPVRLDELLGRLRQEGRTVIAVVSCACATPIGAFDPLPEIAEVCRKHGVWMHVDAAHGGGMAFSATRRRLIAGIELADSAICDAHKMMFMPALCAFVFYRQGRHRFETFQQDAPYLFDPSMVDATYVDSGVTAMECTKRAASFGVWGLWSVLGPTIFGDLVDVTCETARRFHEILQQAPDFEVLHEPECNIVAFRYTPPSLQGKSASELGEFQRAIRRGLIDSGEFYITQADVDGATALRVSVMNPLTDETYLVRLLESIRQTAARLS